MSKKMHKKSACNSHLVVVTELVVSRIQCINYQQNFPTTWDISSKLADFQFYKKTRMGHNLSCDKCIVRPWIHGVYHWEIQWGVRDARPLSVQILSFSYSFRKISCQILFFTPNPGVGAPLPGVGNTGYAIVYCISQWRSHVPVRVNTFPDQLFSCSSWCMKCVSSSWSVCSVGSSSSSSSITNSCATLCTTENI